MTFIFVQLLYFALNMFALIRNEQSNVVAMENSHDCPLITACLHVGSHL